MLVSESHPAAAEVPSYLNCSLSLLEYHIDDPTSTGVDIKIPRAFLQSQVNLQK